MTGQLTEVGGWGRLACPKGCGPGGLHPLEPPRAAFGLPGTTAGCRSEPPPAPGAADLGWLWAAGPQPNTASQSSDKQS